MAASGGQYGVAYELEGEPKHWKDATAHAYDLDTHRFACDCTDGTYRVAPEDRWNGALSAERCADCIEVARGS